MPCRGLTHRRLDAALGALAKRGLAAKFIYLTEPDWLEYDKEETHWRGSVCFCFSHKHVPILLGETSHVLARTGETEPVQ